MFINYYTIEQEFGLLDETTNREKRRQTDYGKYGYIGNVKSRDMQVIQKNSKMGVFV